jgi:hypothetical protein
VQIKVAMEEMNMSSGVSITQYSRDFLKFMDIVNTITNILLGAVAFAAISIGIIMTNTARSAHIILVAGGVSNLLRIHNIIRIKQDLQV